MKWIIQYDKSTSVYDDRNHWEGCVTSRHRATLFASSSEEAVVLLRQKCRPHLIKVVEAIFWDEANTKWITAKEESK